MPWNYRVFHTCYHPPEDGQVIHYYSIRETYYRADGRIYALGGQASAASGDTLTELMKDHAQMQAAFLRPILTPSDIAGYEYGKYERDPDADASV